MTPELERVFDESLHSPEAEGDSALFKTEEDSALFKAETSSNTGSSSPYVRGLYAMRISLDSPAQPSSPTSSMYAMYDAEGLKGRKNMFLPDLFLPPPVHGCL